MFNKIKILEIFKKFNLRFFKVASFSKQITKVLQYHSGGDDYCPLKTVEGLGGNIGNNPSNGFVFAWKDNIERKCQEGEKRIYSVKIDEDTNEEIVAAEIFLKNDGTVEISGETNLTISCRNLEINASENATITSPVLNLGGEGGAFVLTENSQIVDGEGRNCTITSNTTNTKAV